MNLQQLKYICAVVDHGLNVSDAADALFTSQPGISKQIRQLEDELGLQVFVRQGKRLTMLTPAGEVVITTARRALREIANMKRENDHFYQLFSRLTDRLERIEKRLELRDQ